MNMEREIRHHRKIEGREQQTKSMREKKKKESE